MTPNRIIFPATVQELTPAFIRRLLMYPPAQGYARHFHARRDGEEAVAIASLALIEAYPRLRLDDPGCLFVACGWIASALRKELNRSRRLYTNQNIRDHGSVNAADESESDHTNDQSDPPDRCNYELLSDPFEKYCGNDVGFMRDVCYNGVAATARALHHCDATIVRRRQKVMQRLRAIHNPAT